jgi:hypothetical protein
VSLWRFRSNPIVRHVRFVADRVPFEHDTYGVLQALPASRLSLILPYALTSIVTLQSWIWLGSA